MNKFMQLTAIAALILVATLSEAQTLRATDIDSATWMKIFSGQLRDLIVEFRQGDEIPTTLTAEGDFFETLRTQPTPLSIKKNFWMKVEQNNLLFSLDGTDFKPLPQVASGTLSIGTGAGDAGGRANQLNINLKAYRK
ncbi:MAG TPA: hypothetical protein VIG33_09440 [Pseudobdellovibrionaceae bacterium]|jgi:hypothetical protein